MPKRQSLRPKRHPAQSNPKPPADRQPPPDKSLQPAGQTSNPASRPLQERNCPSPIVIIDHHVHRLPAASLASNPAMEAPPAVKKSHLADRAGQVLDSNTLTESVEIQLTSLPSPLVRTQTLPLAPAKRPVLLPPNGPPKQPVQPRIKKARKEPGTMRELKWLNAQLSIRRPKRKLKWDESRPNLTGRRHRLSLRRSPALSLP